MPPESVSKSQRAPFSAAPKALPFPLPDFAAEVRTALARPSSMLIPKDTRDLIQRMAEHINELTWRENELRGRVIALEESAPGR